MPLDRVSRSSANLSLVWLDIFAGLSRLARRKRKVGPGPQQADITRVAVVELWNIGDVILAMQFLAQLRRVFPGAKIILVAKPFAGPLLSGTGLVDEIIPVDLTWTPTSTGRLRGKTIGIWRAARALRRHRVDIAFSSRPHVREHVLLALSGAARTVGYSIGAGNGTLTDPIGHGDAQTHKVADWLRLLEPFGGTSAPLIPRLNVSNDEQMWANNYVSSRGVRHEDLVIGIHPGASLAAKRWPLDCFREITASIVAQKDVRPLVFADPSGYGKELFTIPGVIGAQVSLRDLIALIGRCDLLVCNDSGPMHIAGALGVPTVALFGSGIGQWFAPLGEGHQLLEPAPNESAETGAGGIRSPAGIGTGLVLDAIGRAMRRRRAPGRFTPP